MVVVVIFVINSYKVGLQYSIPGHWIYNLSVQNYHYILSIGIAESLLEISQLVFSTLTYYGTALVFYLLTKGNKGTEKKGIKYA